MFEHRCVCHDVYHALYGSGPQSWLNLAAVFLYCLRYRHGFGRRVAVHLLAQDEAPGRTPNDWRSWRRRRYDLRGPLFALSCMLKVLVPWYTPKHRNSLATAERFLAAM